MAYCTSGAIDQEFGAVTVTRWADLDNTANAIAIAARKAAAIALADSEIDSLLRDTHYRKPFVTAAGGTPTVITHLSAIRAGIWLKAPRGQDTYDEKGAQTDSLTGHRNEYNQTIERIKSGDLRLDAI
jgi:hypothetical protein